MANTHPTGGSQHHAPALPLRKARRRSNTPLPWHKPCDRTESLSSRALLSAWGDQFNFWRLTVMRVRLGCGRLHFRHRNHWEKPDEEQEQRSKNSNRADVRPDIDPSGVINSP